MRIRQVIFCPGLDCRRLPIIWKILQFFLTLNRRISIINRRFYRLAAAALVPAVIFVCAADAGAKDHRRDWAEDKLEDINDDYQKAIKKIDKSSFNEEQKKLLTAQAEANRNLATAQIKAVSEQMTKNRNERASFKEAIRASRENRKAVREIDDIL